jgi:putative spermidine/putrescine transport system permease protein
MVRKILLLRKTNNFFMILLSLFLFLPFIPLAIWSFTKQWPWPLLMPERMSGESWHYLFSDSGMAISGLNNSVIVAVLTLIANLILGIPAAKALAQHEFKGKKVVFIFLLSPLFIPYTVSVMGMHDLALRLEFLNPYISVALGHLIVTLPYFIATIWFQFRLMGRKIQEAASMLGANAWKIFWLIEFPLLRPSILLGSLLVMIISLSQYLPTWIMSGGTLLTLPLIIFPYASSGSSSLVSAYSLWFFLPVFLLLMIYLLLIKFTARRKV